jgi:hypothetical protein
MQQPERQSTPHVVEGGGGERRRRRREEEEGGVGGRAQKPSRTNSRPASFKVRERREEGYPG